MRSMCPFHAGFEAASLLSPSTCYACMGLAEMPSASHPMISMGCEHIAIPTHTFTHIHAFELGLLGLALAPLAHVAGHIGARPVLALDGLGHVNDSHVNGGLVNGLSVNAQAFGERV